MLARLNLNFRVAWRETFVLAIKHIKSGGEFNNYGKIVIAKRAAWI